MSEILGDVSPQEVGKKIKEAREKQGYSTSVLGERIGVSHVTILNVEKGKKFSTQTLVALAKELNNSFGVTWLQEHLDRFTVPTSDFYGSFENKMRQIAREEIEGILDVEKNRVTISGKNIKNEKEKESVTDPSLKK